MTAGAVLHAFNHNLMITTIPLIVDFLKDLELHDWNYQFADDNIRYTQGREKQKAIEYVRNTNPDLDKIAHLYLCFKKGLIPKEEFQYKLSVFKAEALIAA